MLKAKALEFMVAYANAGTYEKHNLNDGIQINKFQKLFGGVLGTPQSKGSPYCMYACLFAYVKAYCAINGVDASIWGNLVAQRDAMVSKHIIPYTGSCTEAMEWAKKRGQWIEKAKWAKATPSDLIIFDFTKAGHELQRHVGMLKKADAKNMLTVEANTTNEDSTSNDPSHGKGGVYHKVRSHSAVLGFVHIPDIGG